MRHPKAVLILSSLLLAVSQACAQEESSWRTKVDVLVDRWSNDVGSSRVERALTVLEEHLSKRRNRTDGEAQLAKARLLLARATLAVNDDHKQAELAAANYRRAVGTADLAAKLLTGERRHVALALGVLAASYHLQAELGRLELIPDNPESRGVLEKRSSAILKRRGELDRACGQEKAAPLLALETQRVATLRQIDLLGSFPRPVGADDVDGKPVDLTAYQGKVLLIVFWSSKLGDPKLFSEIQAMTALHGKEGFEVLGINLDAERQAMDTLVVDRGLTWRQCFDGQGIAGNVARSWGIRSQPYGVLIDRTGRVRYVNPWERSLELAVEGLLTRPE